MFLKLLTIAAPPGIWGTSENSLRKQVPESVIIKQAQMCSAYKLQYFRKKGSQMALKIAYICLCHADPDFIARAAKNLQYEEDGFFIHVDHKQDEASFRAACKDLPHDLCPRRISQV